MADADPWAGLIDPRAALAKRRAAARTLASSSQEKAYIGKSESVAGSDTCDHFSHSSHSSQGDDALSPTSHNSPKDRKETCSSLLSGTYADPALLAGSPDPDPERSGDRDPAKVAKRLEYGLTHSDGSTIALAGSARAFTVTNTVPSPTAHLSGPAAWRDGLARLSLDASPCPGFRSGEWGDRHRIISHFMDHCAAEAYARGWTALDLFGVHGFAGAARVDSCGALMLPLLRTATALTAEAIAFGPLVYRRRSLPEAVLAWDFAGGTWREETDR